MEQHIFIPPNNSIYGKRGLNLMRQKLLVIMAVISFVYSHYSGLPVDSTKILMLETVECSTN